MENVLLCAAGSLLDILSDFIGSRSGRYLELVFSLHSRYSYSFAVALEQLILTGTRGISLAKIAAQRTSDSNLSGSFCFIPIVVSSGSRSNSCPFAASLSPADLSARQRSLCPHVVGSRPRVVMSVVFLVVFLGNSTPFCREPIALVGVVLAGSWPIFKSR